MNRLNDAVVDLLASTPTLTPVEQLRLRIRKRRRRRVAATVTLVLAVSAGSIGIVASLARHDNGPRITVSPTTGAPNPPSSARATSSTTIPAGAVSALQNALRAWATFPVDTSPRPLVLTSDPVSNPADGFPSDNAKEAFASGAFVAPRTLPPGPAQASGYPIVSAAEALAVMRAEGTPAGGAPSPPAPLVITGVRFGTSTYATDRGTLTLPAWLFSFSGVQNPAAVLAVGPAARFPTPAALAGPASVGARLAADGRTATISFVGAAAGHGPCTADYAVDQLPSTTAVAVRVRTTRAQTGSCAEVGYSRHVVIRLAEPLGPRVLVDAATKAAVATAP